MIDKNALNIANKWFSSTNNGFNELRETVYQARFLGRLPYAVVNTYIINRVRTNCLLSMVYSTCRSLRRTPSRLHLTLHRIQKLSDKVRSYYDCLYSTWYTILFIILIDEKSLFTTCMLFNWFLDEVYPGLLADRSIIEAAYTQHLSGDLSMQFLRPLIDQYSKVSSYQLVAINAMSS